MDTPPVGCCPVQGFPDSLLSILLCVLKVLLELPFYGFSQFVFRVYLQLLFVGVSDPSHVLSLTCADRSLRHSKPRAFLVLSVVLGINQRTEGCRGRTSRAAAVPSPAFPPHALPPAVHQDAGITLDDGHTQGFPP